MFKKIEVWILYLAILLGVCFTIGFGILVRQELVGSTKLGQVSKWALNIAEVPISFIRIFGNDFQLEDRFPELSGFEGQGSTLEGYLMISRYDYDGEENTAIVELIDLATFEILHQWKPDIDFINAEIDTSNPEFKKLMRDNGSGRAVMHHPLLMPDGGLVFQNTSPLVKIDYCSQLVWINQDDNFHHSNEVDADGNIWVPTHMFPYALKEQYVGNQVGDFYDDAITKISPDGEILFQKSVAEILLENGMKHLVFALNGQYRVDPLHLNDIQPTLDNGPYWKRGDVFLSLKHPSMILLYRPDSNELIWTGSGHFSQQHDVDILNNHEISIFNNNAISTINGYHVDDHSEMVIYNFKSNSYRTFLDNSLAKERVKTRTNGLGQILNGVGLFIEESNYGRILFFDEKGALKWTYVNRASEGSIFPLSWSRILYTEFDRAMIKNLLLKESCHNDSN